MHCYFNGAAQGQRKKMTAEKSGLLTYGKSLSIPTLAESVVLPLWQQSKVETICYEGQIKMKLHTYVTYLPREPSKRQVTSGLPLRTLTLPIRIPIHILVLIWYVPTSTQHIPDIGIYPVRAWHDFRSTHAKNKG